MDLKAVIGAIVDSYAPMAAAEGVTLSADLPEERYLAAGDHNSFSVLFDNLIVNGIKYNRPGGTVVVRAERTRGRLIISVADTGMGVADADVPFLFDEFFRGGERGGKKTSGTGLGLPICKRIVNELGGRIEVESKAGVGSVFRVELPAESRKGNGGGNVGEAGARAPGNGAAGR